VHAKPPPLDDPAERSAIFRSEFGKSWRAWAWVQRQFTPTSLGAIGFLIVAAGTYIVHLRENVIEVTTRVIVLEKQVIPVLQDSSAVTMLRDTVAAHEQRITRLEANWDDAKTQAGSAPTTRRQK
jgi:hypothetical protein